MINWKTFPLLLSLSEREIATWMEEKFELLWWNRKVWGLSRKFRFTTLLSWMDGSTKRRQIMSHRCMANGLKLVGKWNTSLMTQFKNHSRRHLLVLCYVKVGEKFRFSLLTPTDTRLSPETGRLIVKPKVIISSHKLKAFWDIIPKFTAKNAFEKTFRAFQARILGRNNNFGWKFLFKFDSAGNKGRATGVVQVSGDQTSSRQPEFLLRKFLKHEK